MMKLRDLGNTPDEIAEKLQKLGIKGDRWSMYHCPIVNFYNKFCGGLVFAPYVGHLRSKDEQCLDPVVPGPVRDFMREFDNGKYTELMEPDAWVNIT